MEFSNLHYSLFFLSNFRQFSIYTNYTVYALESVQILLVNIYVAYRISNIHEKF